MCIGIPMQIEQAQGRQAWARGRHGRLLIDTALLGGVQPGDWVLAHLNAARERLDPRRAAEIDEALDLLELAAAGDAAAAGASLSFALPSALSAGQLAALTGAAPAGPSPAGPSPAGTTRPDGRSTSTSAS